jgi:hypothetical protein
MELWELLTGAEVWTNSDQAIDKDGVLVRPHSPRAVRFSLLGGLAKCYLRPDEVWNPQYEEVYLLLGNLCHKYVHHNALTGAVEAKEINLKGFNNHYSWNTVSVVIKKFKKLKKGLKK